MQNSTLLATIFSFVRQNLTQHLHRTSYSLGIIHDFPWIADITSLHLQTIQVFYALHMK